MTLHPGASVPQACGTWGDAKAAYRLLNEPDVTPDALQGPHRALTREACAAHPLVLVVQDSSDLDFTFHNKLKAAGTIGDGRGRGARGARDARRRRSSPACSVHVLSGWRHKQPRDDLSVYEFAMALAGLGGHPNRKGDGFPGWLTLWRAWEDLQLMVRGPEAIRCVIKVRRDARAGDAKWWAHRNVATVAPLTRAGRPCHEYPRAAVDRGSDGASPSQGV